MSDRKRTTEGISGTIELTEDSSQELLRILEEQEAEFFNELLEGKRDLTIWGSDGRSVELTPKKNRRKVWIVSYIDIDDKELTVTAWDNEEAATKHYNIASICHERAAIDEAHIFSRCHVEHISEYIE